MPDDPHLLDAIASGDTDAFGRWASAVEPRLRTSLRSAADQVDVESVVQETLLRVWQAAPTLHPDGKPNPLLRLAFRISRNLVISELRRVRARPAVLARAEQLGRGEPRAPNAPDPMLREQIHRCRHTLPTRPAQALDARLQAVGRPDRDIAEALGMRLNTFLQNVTRAKRLLAACLEKHGVDWRAEMR
jgi:RNA polymerase sigma-70 factor (ECF subfamily)